MSEESNQNNNPASQSPHSDEKPDTIYPSVPDGSLPYREYSSLSDDQASPENSYPPPPSAYYNYPPPNEQPNPGYGYPPPPNGQPNPGYGYPPPPNGQPYPGYGYPSPPNGQPYPPRANNRQPLPLGEAIKQLPKQYLRVLTRPSAATFAEEKQKAAWNIIWVQIAFIAIIGALISFAAYTYVLPTFVSLFNLPKIGTTSFADMYKGMALQGSLTALFSTPISLFINWTIYYFIAKLFKGQGEFIEYVYSALLFYVPIQIISGLLLLIPFVGFFLSAAVGIYMYVLMILMTMAVHRLSGGRATLAVLILPIIALVLVIISVVLLIAIFSALASSVAR
ncbi:Yip1 family protein [Dictyobacter aurantiacus]|uniref:Yip1 domain-containing protein n=1 Tax=Dictyobacter aurantiacus TaxID=1936993 RepID=A0A401ZME8_9CHLR|nr:Yip1 family protein [Dictyobacter aurantiacus]GCE08051.1 hypothetical protein KDAU_53800 [Dictyobacter aurantiacus]